MASKATKVDYAALKKGGFMRQKQKDHFSLRLHVVGGAYTSDELRAIGEVADEFGNGTVHLTSRQGVEIPFVKLEDVEAIRAALVEKGLRQGVCGPRVRTVTACQGSTVCPSANIDAQDIAEKIDKRYYGVELPHKFKFGCTGCHNNCLKAEENDVGIKGSLKVRWLEDSCIACGICVKACRAGAITLRDGKIIIDEALCTNCGKCAKACPVDAWETSPGYTVSFGGAFGNTIYRGREIVPFIKDEDQLFRVTDAAIEYFRTHARAGERMGHLLERAAEGEFEDTIKEAYDG